MAMFYEKRIRSFSVLERELRHLDSDAGVRVVGTFRNRPCFAFVTRFEGIYTTMIHVRGGSTAAPRVGRRILAREFESREELAKFLKALMPRRVEAYLY